MPGYAFGNSDSNYGMLLKGDGKGHFAYINQSLSGFNLEGDVRSVLKINDLLFFGTENGLKVFDYNKRNK